MSIIVAVLLLQYLRYWQHNTNDAILKYNQKNFEFEVEWKSSDTLFALTSFDNVTLSNLVGTFKFMVSN